MSIQDSTNHKEYKHENLKSYLKRKGQVLHWSDSEESDAIKSIEKKPRKTGFEAYLDEAAKVKDWSKYHHLHPINTNDTRIIQYEHSLSNGITKEPIQLSHVGAINDIKHRSPKAPPNETNLNGNFHREKSEIKCDNHLTNYLKARNKVAFVPQNNEL